MKSKTEAAKVLLEAGWTIEEVFGVLQVRGFHPLGDGEQMQMNTKELDDYLSQSLTKLRNTVDCRKGVGL